MKKHKSSLGEYRSYPMTEAHRQLVLRIVDGKQELLPVVFFWHGFTRCEEILNWCLRNKLTGINLIAFLRETIGQRPLVMQAGQEILKRIDKENELKPVIVGRDFKGLI